MQTLLYKRTDHREELRHQAKRVIYIDRDRSIFAQEPPDETVHEP